MLKIEYIRKEDLKPYANNAKIHTAEQIEQIKKSIKEFGFNDPVAVWHDNEVIEGHGRLMAVMEMNEITEVPIIRLDNLSDEERKAYMLVHNKLTMNTDFDSDLLDIELGDILDIDMSDFGFSISTPEYEFDELEKVGSLADKFLIAPFSVIHGNKGDWLDRKRKWIDLGIKSEIGRGEKLVYSMPDNIQRQYKGR